MGEGPRLDRPARPDRLGYHRPTRILGMSPSSTVSMDESPCDAGP
ncbi:hypothetical protein PAI11_42560 [Patulibacter medicamentivorans]|uniref:Uncharacterized protein n=1 Tax=Patulibacter medicamentivorans TaxID=1097667 RepID=H0EBM4_9ACTN|nr:hypothetical protein PAI11_42560 [Patulibacter medicamentivorans]